MAAKKHFHERALELGRSGKFKKVRVNDATGQIEAKPRPPEAQQFRPVGDTER